MKDATMTLTTEDLSAIKGIFDTTFDDRIETKVRPMMHEIVNKAIETKVPAIVHDAIETKVPPMIKQAVDELALLTGKGFNEVSNNFAIVRADIAELKRDVSVLKDDASILKDDISELKSDVREVKWGLADTVRRAEFLDVRSRVERLEQHPRPH